jgi:hypothetical protein
MTKYNSNNIVTNIKTNKYMILISFLALLLSVFTIEAQEQEPQVMTDHYLPEDIWLEIADYLNGSNLFLNTDLSRHFSLDTSTKDKIFRSFIKRLKKVDHGERVGFVKDFYKQNKLNACLHNWAYFFGQLDSALEACDAKKFREALNSTNTISKRTLKKLMELLLVEASSLQLDLKGTKEITDISKLSKKYVSFYMLVKFYLFNKITKLCRSCEGALLLVVIPLFLGLNIVKHFSQLYYVNGKFNRLINSENLAFLCLLYSAITSIEQTIKKIIKHRKQAAFTESQKIIDLIHTQLE